MDLTCPFVLSLWCPGVAVGSRHLGGAVSDSLCRADGPGSTPQRPAPLPGPAQHTHGAHPGGEDTQPETTVQLFTFQSYRSEETFWFNATYSAIWYVIKEQVVQWLPTFDHLKIEVQNKPLDNDPRLSISLSPRAPSSACWRWQWSATLLSCVPSTTSGSWAPGTPGWLCSSPGVWR